MVKVGEFFAILEALKRLFPYLLQHSADVANKRSYKIITKNYFLFATKTAENTINILNCYFKFFKVNLYFGTLNKIYTHRKPNLLFIT